MKNYTLNRIGIVGFCIMLFTSAFALPAMAQSNDNVDVTSIAKVTTFNHLTVIPAAGATLMRSFGGLSLIIRGLALIRPAAHQI